MKHLIKSKMDLLAELHLVTQELNSLKANSIDEKKNSLIEGNLLNAANERLSFYTEHSPMAIIEWNESFIVTEWTGASEKIFGWSAGEIIGKRIMDLNLIFEPDISIVQGTMEKLMNGDSVQVISQNRNITKSGEIIYCMWYNTILKDKTGKMLYVLSQVIDITRQKHAEADVIRKEELLNITGMTAQVGGWMFYVNTKKQIWTKEVYNIYEVDLTFDPDVINAYEFYAPTYKPVIQSAVRNCIENGEPFDLLLEFITAKGNRIWVRSIGKAFQKDGRTEICYGSIQNVTSRLKVMNELQESLEQNALFIKHSPILAYIKSVSEGESKILLCSENYAELIGKPISEITGKNMFELFSPDDAAMFTEDDQSVIASKMILHQEEEVMGRYYTSIKFPIIFKDKSLLAGYAIDITNIKEAEAKLKMKNEQLAELNSTKDKFFSIIAHDLRNPFNTIMGFSEILEDHIKSKDYENIEKFASLIKKSSVQVMDLLTNLLEWSRLQTGKIQLRPEYFEIGSIIDQIVNFLNGTAKQKEITISTDISSSGELFADKEMIDTVIRNLISNAIKFTPLGGTITILTKQTQEEQIVIVQDNGIGIKQEAIDKLFRIDENHSTLGTQKEKGTGLGLSLCKEFIEKHGGKIWVESEVGKGSTFSFSIPIIQPSFSDSI